MVRAKPLQSLLVIVPLAGQRRQKPILLPILQDCCFSYCGALLFALLVSCLCWVSALVETPDKEKI